MVAWRAHARRHRADVTAALERREALRTWPMRGTVHLVPARDAHWMLEVSGERALGGGGRGGSLGLTEAVADRAVDVLGAALAGGRRLTRAECIGGARGRRHRQRRPARLPPAVVRQPAGVTCIAPHVGGEQTFVLLDEWVPDPRRPERDEALAIIARALLPQPRTRNRQGLLALDRAAG